MSRAHALLTLALAALLHSGCAMDAATDDTDGADGADDETSESVSASALTATGIESNYGGCPVTMPDNRSACTERYIGCVYLTSNGRKIGMYCDGSKWIISKRVQ